MPGKRVVFFGVTGVEKTGDERNPARWGALRRLARWVEDYRGCSPRPLVVDFERKYLFNPAKGGKVWHSLLGDKQEKQRQIWRRTWARFVNEIQLAEDHDLFVSMHGCIVRGHYGVRTIIDPRDVAEWVKGSDSTVRAGADLIVTLLDDVYDMWWRTEERAGGTELYGRPTIEQLIFARRAELMVADQVAHSVDPPIPHFMISVAHPCETLANRIYSRYPTVVYLCFPISAPRDLELRNNDTSGKAEVMDFVRTAYERQHDDENLVMVCPLGIDELPLVDVTKEAIRKLKREEEEDVDTAPPVQFDRDSLRWAMASLWNRDACLSSGPPPTGSRGPIPLAQLDAAAGMIHTDVGWRDYRLIEQCDETGCLAAFNPKFKNRKRLSRSVRREIRFATGICPVFVYQDPAHDPDDKFEAEFPQGGTMPPGEGELMVIRKDTIAEVFDEVERLAERNRRLR